MTDRTGPVVRLAPMDADRLPAWIEAGKADYRADRIRAGEPVDHATDEAEQTYAAWFAHGEPAPDHLVRDVVWDEAVVGSLWVGPQSIGRTDEWWVWNVEIAEEYRGRGFGRRAMELAEDLVREHGATSLGLNVFGFNTAARRLYESLGYDVAAVRMSKPLDAERPGMTEPQA